MGWQTENGTEGYAAYVLRDGRTASFMRTDGLGIMHDYGVAGRKARDEVVPWCELLGWEATCSCGWIGSMWRALDGNQDPAELELPGGMTAEDDIHRQWKEHLPRCAQELRAERDLRRVEAQADVW